MINFEGFTYDRLKNKMIKYYPSKHNMRTTIEFNKDYLKTYTLLAMN